MDRGGPAAARLIAGPTPAVAPAPDAWSRRIGRDGRLRLRFERRGERTVLAACRYTLPLQVLAPVALADPAVVVSVLNPTGGLVGGDRLAMHVEVGAGAHACLTTPSATRVYRTAGEPVVQDVRIDAGPGAVVEWVPEHTIPFPGSRLRQRLDATLGPGARLIVIDAFAAGRIARGEAWQFASLESAVTVRDAGGWRWVDRLALEGGRGDLYRGPGVTDGHDYFATVALVGAPAPDDADRSARGASLAGNGPGVLAALGETITGELGRHAGVVAGAGVLARDGLVVRILAREAPQLLDAVGAAWACARRGLLGLPPLALRR